MRKLYTTVHGSRLYGTSTPESDYDYKCIYMPDLKNLLLAYKIDNDFYSTGKNDKKNTAEDTDYEYIAFHTFARDFIRGQTYALEVAFSVVSEHHTEKTIHEEWFKAFCERLIANYLTVNMKSTVGYALSQSVKYGLKGERLKEIKALKELIEFSLKNGYEATDKLEVLKFDIDTMESKYLYNDTYSINGDLNNQVKLPCVVVNSKIFGHACQLGYVLKHVTTMYKNYGKRSQAALKADGVDWKALGHACRISYQGTMLLKHGVLEFPFKPELVKHLLDIKFGKMKYADVEDEIQNNILEIERLQGESSLPEHSDELSNLLEQDLYEYIVQAFKDDLFFNRD